ncbi:lasso peptide biosynthesis protein [Thermoactinomyces mirandus]|uniref:Lasso peptide biosynthesis protein n=1 Tax=Thermoactinomyces mirandus TaxID=2756294 RepID=A0A7W1XR85_9BACL|nr:lasso peptide biosynthesis protein [Thermoactinomyces mirandus]MBA4601769.1 lasso peptide biosynthesis protein [Thermoactinomyces mirandus]
MDLYYALLFAKDRIAKIPPIPARRLWLVIKTSLYMLFYYRKHGLNEALCHLKTIECTDPVQISHPLLEFLYARRIMVYSQLSVRIFSIKRVDSFLRSLALCASLKKLGIPAQMVLGEKNEEYVIERLHFWVEIRGVPLNESWEVEWHFREIKRIPERLEDH